MRLPAAGCYWAAYSMVLSRRKVPRVWLARHVGEERVLKIGFNKMYFFAGLADVIAEKVLCCCSQERLE